MDLEFPRLFYMQWVMARSYAFGYGGTSPQMTPLHVAAY